MKKTLIIIVSIFILFGADSAMADYSFKITVDPIAHNDYGFSYPVTYKFRIPVDVNNLKVSRKNNLLDSWKEISIKTKEDFFNGVDAVRFDYSANLAYVSVSFGSDSDDIYLLFRDYSDNPISGVSFVGTARYYDDRKSAVVISGDDWDGEPLRDKAFQDACDMMTAKQIWFTPGIVTQGMRDGASSPNWKIIQSKINAGYIEPASHSQKHFGLSYGEYETYESEINGSKSDIINNLDLPDLNKKDNKEYIYVWIEPYSRSDADARTMLGESKYLFDRSAMESKIAEAGKNYATWDAVNNLYNRLEPVMRMEKDTFTTDINILNTAFDNSYSEGKIYHLYTHPVNVDWSPGSYADQHLDYIKGRKDVWYAGLGHLYLYHYAQERGNIIVTDQAYSNKVLASTLSVVDFVNNEAPSAYFYSQEFDKLVLDITIPSGIIGQEDKLSALTIKNNGTARERDDITKFKLWKDAGDPGFQGMGKDEELGTFIYYGPNISWYLSGLNTVVPSNGLRIFVSAEIAKTPTASRFIKMQIPSLYDENGNKTFDLGDAGVFMESKNNGPEIAGLINSFSQTIRTFLIDNLDPVSVITDPENNSVINSLNYAIKGVARDQGGSTPAWVRVSINNGPWIDVNSTASNYLTWEYQWQDIKEGNYTIKTQSADWTGNIETEGDSVNVTVKFPIKEEPVSDEPSTGEEDKEESASAPDGATADKVEQLQEKIKQVQQQIIELLNQLIQLIQEELKFL